HALVEIDLVARDLVAQIGELAEVDGHDVVAVAQTVDHLLGQGTRRAGDQHRRLAFWLFGRLVCRVFAVLRFRVPAAAWFLCDVAHEKMASLCPRPFAIRLLISFLTFSTRSVISSSVSSSLSKCMGSPKLRITLAGNTNGSATG